MKTWKIFLEEKKSDCDCDCKGCKDSCCGGGEPCCDDCKCCGDDKKDSKKDDDGKKVNWFDKFKKGDKKKSKK